ncbi:MAG: hypothetical protein ACOC33_02840 [bacterium]
MSKFDYLYFRFSEIVDIIEQEIKDNNAEPRPQDFFEPYNFNEKTISEFRKGIEFIKKAQTYAHIIDKLLSGDYCEEDFHQRLAEEKKKLNNYK